MKTIDYYMKRIAVLFIVALITGVMIKNWIDGMSLVEAFIITFATALSFFILLVVIAKFQSAPKS